MDRKVVATVSVVPLIINAASGQGMSLSVAVRRYLNNHDKGGRGPRCPSGQRQNMHREAETYRVGNGVTRNF